MIARRSLVALTLLLPVFAAAPAAAGAAASQATPATEATETARYGRTPSELLPYRRAGEPYQRFFLEPPQFRGPGREAAPPAGLAEVRLGVLAPLGGMDEEPGRRFRNGVTLALEEANAAGGYGDGLPFVAVTRDENLAWGATGNAVVDLATDAGVWGFIGALEDAGSHVAARVLLKLEVPLGNTAGLDPTLTEHAVPWVVRVRPDDRQNGYRLARRIFDEDGHERVVLFRSNDRLGRVGTSELADAARRLHRPIALELRFRGDETDWAVQLERILEARPDAIVLWGRPAATGRALRALREAGLDVPVYGPDRLVDPAFLAAAGPAAEGLVVTHPYDPGRDDAAWVGFLARYRERFGAAPDAFAAYAYDGTQLLVAAIREAGLNRPRIRDALFARASWEGVTGTVVLDSTGNAVSPVVLGRVADGRFRF
jgi:ABC-type branched-subunit amino acid transport system substrate-binding protein